MLARHGIGDVLIQFELCLLNKNTTDFVHLEKLENNFIKYVCVRQPERKNIPTFSNNHCQHFQRHIYIVLLQLSIK